MSAQRRISWPLIGAILILMSLLVWLGERLEREAWDESAKRRVWLAETDPWKLLPKRPEPVFDDLMLDQDSVIAVAKEVQETGSRARSSRHRIVLFGCTALAGIGLLLVIFGGIRQMAKVQHSRVQS